MQAPVIELKDVYKSYESGEAQVEALHGVSLTVRRGEFLSVVGRSGSGKSTLMNILGCLDTPTAGGYWLNGANISQLGDAQLSQIRNRRIGFIFQGFNLVESLSALENVELPLIYRRIPQGARRALAQRALERVELSHRLHHRPSQMSGGQQQRVAIARAIAAAPDLILADEPTGNLDSRAGEQVLSILRDLHREGRTVILITHDAQLAARAQRLVRIKDGRIAADFPVEPLDDRCTG